MSLANNDCKHTDYRLCFTLKQHTPIIHFQANQAGATLRATELKPKLDRFLIEHVFENDFEKYKRFLIGWKEPKTEKDKELTEKDFEGKKALDYKVRLKNVSVPKKFKYQTYIAKKDKNNNNLREGSYFGDNSSLEIANINIDFLSFNRKLLKFINNYFIDFILITNFGTRQNKGFGSFSVVEKNGEKIDNYDVEKKILKYYPVFYKTSHSNPLKKILDDYQLIKSGRNRQYKKSLLFEYMCDKYNIGWEKKFLKNSFSQIIHGEHNPISCKQPDDREFRYIRALLGLAEINEYRPEIGKKQVRIESVERDPDDNKKPKYQRFKSPITFKVIDKNIYLLYNDSYKIILNKEFKFMLDREERKLFTPKEFDISDFIANKVAKMLKYKEVK